MNRKLAISIVALVVALVFVVRVVADQPGTARSYQAVVAENAKLQVRVKELEESIKSLQKQQKFERLQDNVPKLREEMNDLPPGTVIRKYNGATYYVIPCLKQLMPVNVAIVGATGAVGQELLTVLAQRAFPIRELKLLASSRSAGKNISFNGQSHTIEELTKNSFDGIQIAFFSAGGSISKEFAPAAVKAKAIVIDNTSAFRMKQGIPLVVPEVNPEQIHKHAGLIAVPNCTAIIMNVAVWPLHKINRVKRIVMSTYQAVSGAGAWGLFELENQIKQFATGEKVAKEKFPHQIVNNLFSHNTAIAANGYNEEENKVAEETQKIFNDDRIMISATCVRVPIPRAHSESINLEFERPMTPDQVRQILRSAPGVKIVDDRDKNHFPMPLEASGQDDVLVGRIRQDVSRDDGRGIELFISGDQLRKGAATNAVQIAEKLI